MRKADLVNQISEKTGIPKVDVLVTLETMFKEVKDTLSQGENIYIRGFGSFSPRYRAPRRAHNPRTGERLLTAAKYTPHFKPGKEMRERVDQSRLTIPLKKEVHSSEDDDD